MSTVETGSITKEKQIWYCL